MRLLNRYRRLSVWNKLGVLAGLASIAGLLLTVLTLLVSSTQNHSGGSSPAFRHTRAGARQVIVFTTLESRYPQSPSDPRQRAEDFLSWLEDGFNQWSRGRYSVTIVRETDNSPAVERIRTAYRAGRLNGVDVLLGGKPEVHEGLSDRLPLHIDPAEYQLPEDAIADDQRWIGGYIGCLGLIWNCAVIDSGWIPTHWCTLEQVTRHVHDGENARYLVPTPKTTSASYALYLSLGTKSVVTGADFDSTTAYEAYARLLASGYCNPRGAATLDLVSRGEAVAGVEWIHDAVWKADVLGKPYPNVRAVIPEDALPSLGCLSIIERPEGDQEGARAFVRYFLSREVQKKHYELQRRLPVIPSVRKEVLQKDGSSFARAALQLDARIDRGLPVSSWGLFRSRYANAAGSWRTTYLAKVEDAMLDLRNLAQARELPPSSTPLRRAGECRGGWGWRLSDGSRAAARTNPPSNLAMHLAVCEAASR